ESAPAETPTARSLDPRDHRLMDARPAREIHLGQAETLPPALERGADQVHAALLVGSPMGDPRLVPGHGHGCSGTPSTATLGRLHRAFAASARRTVMSSMGIDARRRGHTSASTTRPDMPSMGIAAGGV